MKRSIQTVSFVITVVVIFALFFPINMVNHTVLAKENTKGSTIGGVEVTDVENPAFKKALQAAISKWQETPITIKDEEMPLTIDANQLTFDIAAAISQYEAATKRPWYAFWQKKKTVQLSIPVTASDEVMAKVKAMITWKPQETIDQMLLQAGYLRNHEIEAMVDQAMQLDQERIALQLADMPKDALGISSVVEGLNDTIIVPDQPVSLIELLGENVEAMNEIGLNFVASMLYSAVLQTDYEILERHAQIEVPTYLQAGMDAAINAPLEKDLQFINLSNHPSKLHMTIENNRLKVEIFSQMKENEIQVRVEKDRIVNPRVVYRYTDELAAGQEKTVQEGKTGLRVEVYRSIMDGGIPSDVLVSRDYYAPVNRIVERSSRVAVQNTSDGSPNTSSDTTEDPDLQLDLDGNGLADTPKQPNPSPQKPTNDTTSNDPDLVYGYYDKGGNFVQTSP